MRTLQITLAVGLTLGVTACIISTTHHTIYLEADGTVLWTVLEEDVHSDADALADRDREECEWLEAARAGDHGIARGLAVLGGEPMSRVLRDRRPFAVWTAARFESAETLVRALVDGLDLPARIELTTGPTGGGFLVELDLADADAAVDPAENLFDLLAGIEDARLVLVEGEFVAAEGFTLDDDRRVARPVPPPEDLVEAKQGMLRWELRWSFAVPPAASPALSADDPVTAAP